MIRELRDNTMQNTTNQEIKDIQAKQQASINKALLSADAITANNFDIEDLKTVKQASQTKDANAFKEREGSIKNFLKNQTKKEGESKRGIEQLRFEHNIKDDSVNNLEAIKERVSENKYIDLINEDIPDFMKDVVGKITRNNEIIKKFSGRDDKTLTNNVKSAYADSSKEVQGWYKKHKGDIGVKSPTDSSGIYNGQCVSLVKNFAKEEYGIDIGSMGGNGGPQATWNLFGNNKGYAGGFSTKEWSQVDRKSKGRYMPGDIVIQPASAVGGTYGHIVVVVSAEDDNGNFKVMESNWGGKATKSPVQYGRTVNRNKTLGAFRKK